MFLKFNDLYINEVIYLDVRDVVEIISHNSKIYVTNNDGLWFITEIITFVSEEGE